MWRMRWGWFGYAQAIYVKMIAVRGGRTRDIGPVYEMSR